METVSRALLRSATAAACRRFGRAGYGRLVANVPRRRNTSVNVFSSGRIEPLQDTTHMLTLGGKHGAPRVAIDERHNAETGRGKMYMEVTFMKYSTADSAFAPKYAVAVSIEYARFGSTLGIGLVNITGRGGNAINATSTADGQPVNCSSATDVVDSMPAEILLADKRKFTPFEATLVHEALMILADVDGSDVTPLPTVTVARLDGDTVTLRPPAGAPRGEIRGGSIQDALPPGWQDFRLIQAATGDRFPRRYTSWYTVLAAQRNGGDARVYAVRPMDTRGAFSDLAV